MTRPTTVTTGPAPAATSATPRARPVATRAAEPAPSAGPTGNGTLAGTPVAVVGVGSGAGAGHDGAVVAGAAAAVRDALLAAGAAVAGVGPGGPVPPGTRWIVDVDIVDAHAAGTPAGGRSAGGGHGRGRGLGPDSVVVVAGGGATGGRGIGARAAVALARAFGCGVELVGLAGTDDDACHLAGWGGDAATVRRAILGRGELGRPGEIAVERDCTLAAREVRRTLADLSEHAAFAGYRTLDSGDAAALAAAIDEVRTRRGRLDGVVRVAEASPVVGDTAPGEVP